MITPSAISGTQAQEALSQVAGQQDVSRDDFLKLLIAQLQHQDPLNPTENQEFVAELATFSSLEQETQQTKLLEKMIEGQNQSGASQALSLIGKSVSVAQDRFLFQPGQKIHFDFQAKNNGTPIQITTDSGKVVATELLPPGQSTYVFDGSTDQGQLPAGIYNIKVGSRLNENGEEVSDPVFMRGTVEGVNLQQNSPVLIVNGQPVEMSTVNAVFDKGK